ncbi:MAG: nucleotidyl transferase AbiEii/AbiGii toxin family protein [Paracoccaceae bacterium]|nr:nucleotidyl transferase AbiEii/AbiGii toxin family protein [Paracoccaceae bacterium]
MEQSQGRVTFGYRFLSEDAPAMRLRLKVEINTREHFAVCGFTRRVFSVESRWYSGRADITTFELDELLATKLRALYQRRKGRDLFDLAMGLADERSDASRIATAFRKYMKRGGAVVTRAMFERILAGKVGDSQFNADMSALLRPGFEWRPEEAARTVSDRLIPLLPGEPWKEERLA